MKNLDFYFKDSIKKGYAIGAYNFSTLETLKGIVLGCELSNSPCILAVSESALNFLGENFVVPMFELAKKQHKIPMFLHLDHGKSVEICKKAVDLGFNSVMIDASALPFEENVRLTKKVVAYAHKKGVFVEAELGVLAGIEDDVHAEENHFTNPQKAKEFVEKTGCDSLAVAIGTSHGAHKFKGKQEIRFDILQEIERCIPSTPLVLHGASSVPQKFVKNINSFGGNIQDAVGIPEKTLHKIATTSHVFKINTDTDLRLCQMAQFREYFAKHPADFDLRNPNKLAIEEIAKFVKEKNEKVFANAQKA